MTKFVFEVEGHFNTYKPGLSIRAFVVTVIQGEIVEGAIACIKYLSAVKDPDVQKKDQKSS